MRRHWPSCAFASAEPRLVAVNELQPLNPTTSTTLQLCTFIVLNEIPKIAHKARYTMAGPIRQPIDIPALEKYLDAKTEVKSPLDVKQVEYPLQHNSNLPP